MPVVWHQAVRDDPKGHPSVRARHQSQEMLVFVRVSEKLMTLHAPVHQVEHTATPCAPGTSGHTMAPAKPMPAHVGSDPIVGLSGLAWGLTPLSA